MIDTVDKYIDSFDGEIAQRLHLMRSIIRQAAPDAIEKISYKMPTYYLDGNLVHFAANKNHIGFYPTPSAICAFSELIKDYKTSKGTIQFPHDKPLPSMLISQIVEFRVTENTKK